MYQKTLIGSSRMTSSELFFVYFIIEKTEKLWEEGGYGIQISAYDAEKKRIEAEQVHSVFVQREEAESFCYILILNQVTPVTLRDIIEDYIVS